MSYAVPATTKLRIATVLQCFFGPNVAAFCKLLLRTGAHIMGSLPLFCLRNSWLTWVLPNDVDVFLCPTTSSIMRRNVRLLREFLIADGYVALPAIFPNPYYRFYVATFTKLSAPGTWFPSVQLILPHPRIPCSPFWHLNVMYDFDLSCCCVGFDGESFHVTGDNLRPTTQRAIVRHLHSSTPQRILKYSARGIKF